MTKNNIIPNPIGYKWDYESKSYHLCILPTGSKLAAEDNEICDCASCGKPMIFGDGYTSLEIHTNIGLGFCVCESCYREELERRKRYKNND